MTDAPGAAAPSLSVNEVGEYVRHRCCSRRFKLQLSNRREARRLPFYNRLFNALDPVLQIEGARRESSWEQMLIDAGYRQIKGDDPHIPWTEVRAQLEAAAQGERVFAREVVIDGTIGAWSLTGRIDFVMLTWSEGRPRLRIVECKASRRDRTYHRIQASIYRQLILRSIEAGPLVIGGHTLTASDLDAVVARVDEATNTPQEILGLPVLDLQMEDADVLQMLAANGPLAAIADRPLDDLPYQLDSKCDGCVFNTDCLPESGLHRRLELLGLSPPNVRALRRVGVDSIDALAELDVSGTAAQQLQADPLFGESIPRLVIAARTRARNLPDGDEGFVVESIPNSGFGALPEHTLNGNRLVRVYLSVDYDYAENRIGALSAHVTTSANWVRTPFERVDNRWQPHPVVREAPRPENAADRNAEDEGDPAEGPAQNPVGDDGEATAAAPEGEDTGNDQGTAHPAPEDLPEVQGVDVIKFKSSPWTGRYDDDTAVERELIEGFLHELVDAMDVVSETDDAPVHFYVWSPGEIRNLVEACCRAGSNLLGHLRHLMGCRESLDQMIYTAVGREIDRRYALGWTGRGLVVATSLRWFGRVYHWTRQVGREVVRLDVAFTQDLFDFKTTLSVAADGSWAKRPEDGVRHLFEIRARFFDSLTAPYWRALWNVLPDPDTVDDEALANMIRRYNTTGRPNYLREYLRARVHALRWLEEPIHKNREIEKPDLAIRDLKTFLLRTATIGDACVEFLRLDQHVEATDWIAEHLVPPADRVTTFTSIPVRDVRCTTTANVLEATLDYAEYGVDPAVAAANCSIGEGAWVRLTPRPDGPHDGQSVGLLQRLGSTCILEVLDWDAGRVRILVVPLRGSDRYRLQSNPRRVGDLVAEHALIEESPSNYVSPHVDARLSHPNAGTHLFGWLDPTSPAVPQATALPDDTREDIRRFLADLRLPPDGDELGRDQQEAIFDGIQARIQLLQGPPGTGKTHTSAVAILLRVLIRCSPGDIVLISGPTHLAVDNLLQRIALVQDEVTRVAAAAGLGNLAINIGKVHSSPEFQASAAPIIDMRCDRVRPFNQARSGAVAILGGLPSGLLKAASKLHDMQTFQMDRNNLTLARALFVDEASMMVFPNFLALASLVSTDGELIVAGDHRQLAPIVAHDWEREDRPPTVLYQPYVSAYEAVRNLGLDDRVAADQIALTMLEHSFRLPPEVRTLIARVYREDAINLRGTEAVPVDDPGDIENPLEHVWRQPSGLFLVVHDEQESRRANALESEIIRRLLDANPDLGPDSVAIITPHRAQRILLQRELGDTPSVALIDTVERLQGGECENVVVSGTASDPSAIAANVDFLLDLNRSNVAFSRAQTRLIVVCSRSLLDHVPAELEHYQSAQLWKALRALCDHPLATVDVGGNTVTITMCPRTVEGA